MRPSRPFITRGWPASLEASRWSLTVLFRRIEAFAHPLLLFFAPRHSVFRFLCCPRSSFFFRTSGSFPSEASSTVCLATRRMLTKLKTCESRRLQPCSPSTVTTSFAPSMNNLRRSARIRDPCYRRRTTWNLPRIISVWPFFFGWGAVTDVLFQENDTTAGLQTESMDLMHVDSIATTAPGTLSKKCFSTSCFLSLIISSYPFYYSDGDVARGTLFDHVVLWHKTSLMSFSKNNQIMRPLWGLWHPRWMTILMIVCFFFSAHTLVTWFWMPSLSKKRWYWG